MCGGRGRQLFGPLRLHAISFCGAGNVASLEIETAGITDHRSRRRATPEWSAFRTAIAKQKKMESAQPYHKPQYRGVP